MYNTPIMISKNLIFKQVRAEGGCNSFIIADATTRKACIVDPRADELETYLAFADDRKLRVSLVIDTHTHADHYSGSHLVAKHFNASIAMSAETKSGRSTLKLKDGQTVDISDGLGLKALATPGHTPDSISLVFQGDWGQAAFTGDTLFIGGSGRTDFPGADSSAMYTSIHDKLGSLNDATWVMPGHDYSNLLFSTIGQEKTTNPHWLHNHVEFERLKRTELLDAPPILKQIIDFNLSAVPTDRIRPGAQALCATACGTALPEQTIITRKTPEQLAKALNSTAAQDMLFLDIREPSELANGYIPGTRNIPMSELFMHWNELNSAAEVYLICQRGNRTQTAAQTLSRLGLKLAASVTGGFAAWAALKFPVIK